MRYILIAALACACAFGQSSFNASELALVPRGSAPSGACSPNGAFAIYGASVYICDTTWTVISGGSGDTIGPQGLGIAITGAGTSGDPKIISVNTAVTATKNAAGTWTAGAKQTFQASSTTAGANVACAALPSSPATGDVACDSADSNKFKQWNGSAWAEMGSGGGTTVETVAGTTRSLSDADNGKVLAFTSSSAVAVTAPAGLAANFSCLILQWGTGQITVAGDGTSTIAAWNSALKTAGQYAQASIVLVTTNSFWMSGNTVP
jgi:hypothetical protein